MSDTYAIRDKETKQLYRIRSSSNGDAEYCGDTSVYLTLDSDHPIATFSTLKIVRKAISVDTPWYNSSFEKPSWDGFDSDNFEVVIIETKVSETNIEPYETFHGPHDFDGVNDYSTKKGPLTSVYDPIDIKKISNNKYSHLCIAYGVDASLTRWANCIGKRVLLGDTLIYVHAIIPVIPSKESFYERFKNLVIYENIEYDNDA